MKMFPVNEGTERRQDNRVSFKGHNRQKQEVRASKKSTEKKKKLCRKVLSNVDLREREFSCKCRFQNLPGLVLRMHAFATMVRLI